MFFMFFTPTTNQEIFDNEDVGPHLPIGTYPIHRWGEEVEVVELAATDYETIKQNLEGLTANVSDVSIDEIPRHYQCHTVGISSSLSWLLCRVAWEVMCYREQHHWCYFVYESICFTFSIFWSSDEKTLFVIFFIIIYTWGFYQFTFFIYKMWLDL